MTGDRPPSLRLYEAAMAAASPLAGPILAGRALRGKEDPARLGERLGRASRPRPGGPLVWMHGASVGEGLSLLPLVSHFRHVRPDASVLVTTGTRASAELLGERLPQGAFHQYAPVDTPGAVARFIGHWRPTVGVIVESELWPNLILAARASGASLALVSARMSDESLRTWRRAPSAASAIMGAFDLTLARDEAAATRFRALGARVDGMADMKLGAPPLPVDGCELAALRTAFADRPVILAASTHPGEEALILRRFGAVAPAARLIIAPRHIGRGVEVDRLARAEGFSVARRASGEAPGETRVYVADTLGDLGLWYRLAGLAVLGGSLAPGVGGHNPLEAARLGCPFVAGPHVENWPVYADLEQRGATRLISADDAWDEIFRQAVADPAPLQAMAAQAREWVEAHDTHNRAAMTRLVALLPA